MVCEGITMWFLYVCTLKSEQKDDLLDVWSFNGKEIYLQEKTKLPLPPVSFPPTP